MRPHTPSEEAETPTARARRNGVAHRAPKVGSPRALVPTLEQCWYTLFLQRLQVGVGTFLQQLQEVLVRVPTAASGGVGTHHAHEVFHFTSR